MVLFEMNIVHLIVIWFSEEAVSFGRIRTGARPDWSRTGCVKNGIYLEAQALMRCTAKPPISSWK